MKEIKTSVFIGVLLALPIIYFLDDDSTLNLGAIGLILFLTIGFVQFIKTLNGKKDTKNENQ